MAFTLSNKKIFSFLTMLMLSLQLSCKGQTKSPDLKVLNVLPEEVKETSGLALHNDILITHNDAGNKNVLYAIDITSGKIKNRFTINNSKNIDWEDLAQSNEHIFIGDIGNNDGNREDLKIYRVKIEALKQGAVDIKPDAVIGFHYPGQVNFEASKKHNLDSEGLIFYKGNLYLFSKNRGGIKCNLYKIPSQAGNYKAELIADIDIEGRITGAAISPSNNRIVLTGYNKDADSFIYTMVNFKGDNFFSGKNKMITLGPYDPIGQIEGIVFEDEGTILISSEKTKKQDPKLYKIKF
ncbi:MAG: hypothetical protein M3512_00080 [Bacteroidota bacterium]|nr:hypothetical protein [Bacteroidota bacterium]